MDLTKFLTHNPHVLSMKADAPIKFTRCLQMKRSVLIGITGETACGKSMLLNMLHKAVLSGAIIDGDNYFKDISDKIRQAGGFANLCDRGYDLEAPDSFNLTDMYQDLRTLKKGETVYIPLYLLNGTGVVQPHAQKVEPKKYIFIGGISSFFEPVRDLLDFKIYIETDFEERKKRFTKRATTERDMTLNEAQVQFERVNIRTQKYLLPLKQYADIIIRGDAEIDEQEKFINGLMQSALK